MNKSILSITLVLILSGCGGSDSDNSQVPTVDPEVSIATSGSAISNAVVCLDTNFDRVCSSDEPTATTNAAGIAAFKESQLNNNPDFILSVIEGESVSIDGSLISGSYALYAPAGSTVISPLTDTVVRLMDELSLDSDGAVELLSQSLSQANADIDIEGQSILSSFSNSGGYTEVIYGFVSRMLLETRLSSTQLHDQDLLSFITALSYSAAGLTVEEVLVAQPLLNYVDGSWTAEMNFAPIPSVSSITPQKIALTETITSVELSNVFTDKDNDPLTYRLTPALSGLSVINDILQGTPESKFNDVILIQASDGKVWSSPVEFALNVGDAPPPPTTPTIQSAERLQEMSQRHDLVHSTSKGVYGLTLSEVNSSFYLDVTWYHLDGSSSIYSFDNSGLGDKVFAAHPRTGDAFNHYPAVGLDEDFSYVEIRENGAGGFSQEAKGLVPEIDGGIHFATFDSNEYNHWRMTFAQDGMPNLVGLESPVSSCNSNTVMIHAGVSCSVRLMNLDNWGKDSELERLFDNEKLSLNLGVGGAITFTDELVEGAPAGLKMVLRKQDGSVEFVPFEFTNIDGTPKRTFDYQTAVAFSPEQNTVYLIDHALEADSANFYNLMLVSIDLGTLEVKTVNFYGSYKGNAIYPSVEGVYIVPAERVNIFEWLPATSQLIDTTFNSGSSAYPRDMVGYPYPIEDGFAVPIEEFTYDPYQLLYIEVK